MSQISQLTPKTLWKLFSHICTIPHPSHHEEALAQFIMDWAQQQNIHVERDNAGNVLLRKAATVGMENCKSVILQAHMDMVPQKNSDIDHDFTQDPIQPRINGDWVQANGTTLGADNGIGMASALAVLVDDEVEHGPLEVLLTMNEEAGMGGAFGLQPRWLQGEILINTDSEQEGDVYVGCAGSVEVISRLPLQREAVPEHYQIIELSLTGFRGGHSGIDIHAGLGHATKLLTRFIFTHADALSLRLLALQGGTLRNAIPREANVTLAIPGGNLECLKEQIHVYQTKLNDELATTEAMITFSLQPSCDKAGLLTADCQYRLIKLLHNMPNGVFRMSDNLPGAVETSLCIGIVATNSHLAEIYCLIRSLIEDGKGEVATKLRVLATQAGAAVEISGHCPGWQPDPVSSMTSLVQTTYQTLFGTVPNIMVLHAGLECGLFKYKYPQMDMVSIGPTIKAPHSTCEQVHIGSVEKYWLLLKALLKATPEKEPQNTQ